MAVIRAIGTYLPERTVGNDELVERFGWDRTFLEEKLGIHERHVAAEGEGSAAMGIAAAEALFSAHPDLDREAIQLLVLCTQTPDFGLPHSSALIQTGLGLEQTTACFDIGLGCSGFVYGLAVVSSMLERLGLEHALLVTSDPYSKVMNPADRATAPLFGDGAAATWISRSGDGGEIGAFTFGTDGGGAGNLIVQPDEAGTTCLSMNGRAIFEFMQTRVPEDLSACAAANGIELDDVNLFVLHQASAHMLGYLGRRMQLDAERLPIMLEKTGNLVSSSIPFVLAGLDREGRLAGTTTMLCGFGVGLSWASGVIRWSDATSLA